MNKSEKEIKNIQLKAQIATNVLREFCSDTTVHGFRYFTEKSLHWIERFWWLISIIVLVIVCTFATMKVWTEWRDRPVIVSFDDKTTSIGSIPFPAVTICSTKKFNENKLHVYDLLSKSLDNTTKKTKDWFTSDEVNKLDIMFQLCMTSLAPKYTQIPHARRTESIYKTIQFCAPDQNETISTARFHIMNVAFYPTFTEHGLCYTYNSLNSKDIYSDEVAEELMVINQNPSPHWNIEDGYKAGSNLSNNFPHRVFGTKIRDTLSLSLGLFYDNNHMFCFDNSAKLLFALHSPDELPRVPEDLMIVQGNQEVYVSVNPNVIKTSNGLRGYSFESRGCFFKSERKLRFFKLYSQNHCGLECLANYTKGVCKCVPFYLPRDNLTRICTMFDFECAEETNIEFSKTQAVERCNCLPDCTSLTYNSVSTQSQIQIHPEIEKLSNSTRPDVVSKMQISFKQTYFIGLTRTETSTMTDFIASCGGLLGLFMGISILSVIELVYFFTLRLFFKLRREKANQVFAVKENNDRFQP